MTNDPRATAIFSGCRTYRYALWRLLLDDPLRTYTANYAMFIGLNPSTADEVQDDPTIRRCKRFARDWGYDTLLMTNLFAFRSTDPDGLLVATDPVGPDNDKTLSDLSNGAGIVVAAWGVNGTLNQRDQRVRAMFPKLHHLGLTKDGHPKHPLYLKATTKPALWGASRD